MEKNTNELSIANIEITLSDGSKKNVKQGVLVYIETREEETHIVDEYSVCIKDVNLKQVRRSIISLIKSEQQL